MNQDDIDLVKKRAQGLGEISLEYQENLRLKIGPRTLPVDVSGVNPPYGEMRNLIPQAGGRFINPIDEKLKRRVAFVGNELAETLFGAGDPVGQTFRLHGSPFTVVGVLKRKVQQSAYSGRDKDKVVIPATTFRALTGRRVPGQLPLHRRRRQPYRAGHRRSPGGDRRQASLRPDRQGGAG